MSGGHYDYLCFYVSDFAEAIEVKNDARRAAFQKLLSHAAKVCKAIEWEDSGDTGKEDTDEAIDTFFAEFCCGYDTIKAQSFDELVSILETFISNKEGNQ
jgi:hypothetical protein